MTPTEEKEIQELQSRVQLATGALMEFADSVQILVTKHLSESETTASYEYGGGNLHARVGQMHEWLTTQRVYVEENARKNANKP
jgi:hypothetical protein